MFWNASRGPVLVLALAAALMPVAARGDAADDQYAVAAGLYTRQQWKMAAEAAAAFLGKYPEHAEAAKARYLRADCLLRLRQYDEARKGFLDYLAQHPAGEHARWALFRAGEAAHLGNQPQAAEKELKAFLQKYPDDELAAYVLPYLGDIALAANDAATAERYYGQALARFPEGQLQDNCRLGLAPGAAIAGQERGSTAAVPGRGRQNRQPAGRRSPTPAGNPAGPDGELPGGCEDPGATRIEVPPRARDLPRHGCDGRGRCGDWGSCPRPKRC